MGQPRRRAHGGLIAYPASQLLRGSPEPSKTLAILGGGAWLSLVERLLWEQVP